MEEVPGPAIELTPEREAALNEFRQNLPYGAERFRNRDQACLRFLKARNFKVKKALKMLEKHLDWLESYRPKEIDPDTLEVHRRMRKAFWIGHDKLGRPCLVLSMRAHFPGVFPKEENLRFAIYTIQKGLQKRCPPGVHNFVTIFDMRGFTRKNIDFSFGKALAGTLQENFPERQAYSLVIEAPWYFRMLWAVVKPWLDKITVAKIRFLKADWKQQMLRFFEPDQLPVEYGGTMKVNWDPMEEGEPLSSEVTLNTAEEDQAEISAMIREFKAEEEAAGASSSAGVHRGEDFSKLGDELDELDS